MYAIHRASPEKITLKRPGMTLEVFGGVALIPMPAGNQVPRMTEVLATVKRRPAPIEFIIPIGSDGKRLKWCCFCGEWRGRKTYYEDSRNRDGLRSWCKECTKKYERIRYSKKKLAA